MSDRKENGLVIEGGGMRGIYAAGVLDVFMENDIRFDGVLGVSAGAIHACSYCSGQIGRSLRYYKKYCRDPRFVGIGNFLKNGDIVGVDFCYHEIPEKLDPYDYEAFEKKNIKLYAGCSNMVSGKPEYLQVRDARRDIDIIRASSSLPIVSRPVELKGMRLMDGGCTDSIPAKAMHSKLGYRKITVIQTRYRGYIKPSEYNPLTKIIYHDYPNFVHVLANRHIFYNREVAALERWEKEGKIFVIRPEYELKIGRMNATPEELQQVYDIGKYDAARSLGALKAWLEN